MTLLPSEDDLRGRPPLPPGLVDFADIKAPGLADREHLYDGGGAVECPRCAQLEALVRDLRAQVEWYAQHQPSWAAPIALYPLLARSHELVP